ncbi:acyltransferase family protein [Microbulbifer magnicolonia]|uniref:acyltransferase family protein n=1 Tax=Microbulbifer magnicolonia TaxID=3109744 RepID=UPI002B405361|nr:acyltransferase family protein [Microbulbifer sp. GG15]
MSQERKYWEEIDGLRAIAVMSVVLFHAWPGLAPGGFVGVDVFFVISGFLITGQIDRDIRDGRFSIAEFYRRRIKRIVPAVIPVLMFLLCFILFLATPDFALANIKALSSVVLSITNIFYYINEIDYFSNVAAEHPSLHFWSLAVEEQFYIFWPIVLLLCARLGLSFLIAALALFIISFTFGLAYLDSDPSYSYFLPHARAFELLLGAIAFFGFSKLSPESWRKWIRELICVLAVIALLASTLFVNEEMRFPGYVVLTPIVATAFIILVILPGALKSAILLRTKPLRFIGKISYSMYLWHWPILTLFNYYYLNLNDVVIAVLYIATVFSLSVLSYQIVEQRFRRTSKNLRWLASRLVIVPAGVSMTALLFVMQTDGLSFRSWTEYKQQYELLSQGSVRGFKYEYVCQRAYLPKKYLKEDRCVLGPDQNQGDVKILLWGDSNASQYIGVLGEVANSIGFSFSNFEHSSCPPIFSDPREFVPGAKYDKCAKSLNNIYPIIERYDVLFLGGSWSSYAEGGGGFLDALESTVAALVERNKRVLLLGKIGTVNYVDSTCIFKQINNSYLDCNDIREIDPSIVSVNSHLREIAQKFEGVEYLDVNKYVCPDGICSALGADGVPVYVDSGHISLQTSWKIGKLVSQDKPAISMISNLLR